MYPNLEAEMARRKITRKSLAERLHKQPTTISLKLNGKYQLTLGECIEIRDAVDSTLSIEYLFSKEAAVLNV